MFRFAMAGAGISGSRVIGARGKPSVYPATKPMSGGDLMANCHGLNAARWRFPPFDQAVSALFEECDAEN